MRFLQFLLPPLLWGTRIDDPAGTILKSQAELKSFLRKHKRALIGYTTREKSTNGTYQAWDDAMIQIRELFPDVAIAEIMQVPFPDNQDNGIVMQLNKGDTAMAMNMEKDQMVGVTHIGSGWIMMNREMAKEGKIMLGGADETENHFKCPEIPSSLILQFRDRNDPSAESFRRPKSTFFSVRAENTENRIVEFCRTESLRSDALRNQTLGLPIRVNNNDTIPFGYYPLIAKVGALQVQVAGDVPWEEIYQVLKKLARKQKESNIAIILERAGSSHSTILQYEHKRDEKNTAVELRNAQTIQDMYDEIVQHERDGVYDNYSYTDKDPGDQKEE